MFFLGWNFLGKNLTTAGFFEAKFACFLLKKDVDGREKSHCFHENVHEKVELPDQLLPQLARKLRNLVRLAEMWHQWHINHRSHSMYSPGDLENPNILPPENLEKIDSD